MLTRASLRAPQPTAKDDNADHGSWKPVASMNKLREISENDFPRVLKNLLTKIFQIEKAAKRKPSEQNSSLNTLHALNTSGAILRSNDPLIKKWASILKAVRTWGYTHECPSVRGETSDYLLNSTIQKEARIRACHQKQKC